MVLVRGGAGGVALRIRRRQREEENERMKERKKKKKEFYKTARNELSKRYQQIPRRVANIEFCLWMEHWAVWIGTRH